MTSDFSQVFSIIVFFCFLCCLKLLCDVFTSFRTFLRRIKLLGGQRKFGLRDMENKINHCIGHLREIRAISGFTARKLRLEYNEYEKEMPSYFDWGFLYPYTTVFDMMTQLNHLLELNKFIDRLPLPRTEDAGNNRIELDFLLESQIDYEVLAIMYQILFLFINFGACFWLYGVSFVSLFCAISLIFFWTCV